MKKQVEKRFFCGHNVSLLGFGCMRLPKKSFESEAIDFESAGEMVELAMQSGVNYFDTAFIYHGGESEIFIGQALKKYPRDSYFLADKLPNWMVKTPQGVDKYFDLQLQKCGVDYFDFYLVHALNQRGFQKMIDNQVYENLMQKKAEGLIKNLGFSFHDHPSLIRKIVEGRQWDFAQIQLNFVDWLDYGAGEMYEFLSGKGIPVVVMEPIRGGALATLCPNSAAILKEYAPDKSLASWALRYAASLDNIMTVLSGMSERAHVDDNISTFVDFRPLSADERKVLDRAAAEYRKSKTVGCTGCGYCADCGQGVDIPKIFALFNQYVLSGDGESFIAGYEQIAADKKAERCTKCGVCAKLCPQGLDIPALLQFVAKKAANIGI